jgi:hypothetical protein
MSVETFLSHIADDSPTFRCYACGDREESLNLTVRLAHTREAPATDDELRQLRNWLNSPADDFVALYSKHNGLAIYEDTVGDAAGVRLYPVADWPGQTEEMKSQFEAMGVEPDDQPAGVIDALAFGEIPHSANYFTVKLSGPNAGKIFYVDHGLPRSRSRGVVVFDNGKSLAATRLSRSFVDVEHARVAPQPTASRGFEPLSRWANAAAWLAGGGRPLD